MFSEGHTMDEIDDICYWDTCDYAEYISESRPRQHGESRMKQLKPTQLKMIEERKAQTIRENKKRK